MTALRARIDVVLVVEVDGQAVQHAFHTTLRDQIELPKRYPKQAQDPVEGGLRLVFIAAQREEIAGADETFDAFVDRVLDLAISEPPPLTAG